MLPIESLKFLDIHYHAAPDLYFRRYSTIEAGKIYKDLEGAVVLKSHLGSTSIQATIAQAEGLPVFPSVVLNTIAGGIDYRIVLRALAEYQPVIASKLIVHLPTITGRAHISKLPRSLVYPTWKEQLCEPLSIFNTSYKLRPEISELIKLAQDYPIVLSTGHASREETFALVNACTQKGVPLLLNQPANPLTGLNVHDLIELGKNKLVWIEQTALTYLLGYQDKEDFEGVLQNAPNLIYSSDLGQVNQPDLSEWLELTHQWFNEFNISTKRKEEICLTNPCQLLKVT